AGRQFRPGIADADHRTAIEQMRRQPLVLHPRAMRHAVDARLAEPVVTTQFLFCSHLSTLSTQPIKGICPRGHRDHRGKQKDPDAESSIENRSRSAIEPSDCSISVLTFLCVLCGKYFSYSLTAPVMPAT